MRAASRRWVRVVPGLMVLLSCCPGQAAQVERAVLDNGLVVVVGQNTAANVAGVFVGFRVGAATETGDRYPARALLQEHNRAYAQKLLNTDPHFRPLAAEPQTGGEISFNTEWDYVQVQATCTPQNLEQLLQLLARVFRTDPLSPELVDSARQRLIQHYSISQASVPEQAYYLFRQAMLGEVPTARPVSGNPEAIAAVSLDELTAFRQRYFVAANVVIVIISPESAQKIGQLIRQSFGSYPKGLPPIPSASGQGPQRRSNVQVGSSAESQLATVVLGVALPPPGSQGFLVGKVVHQMLAGAQGRLRRDRALLHSLALNLPFQLLARRFPLRSIPVTLESDPYLAIYAEADPKAIESTRRALLRHLESFRQGSMRPEELARAKQRVINDMALTLQRPSTLATHLGQYEMLGLDCTVALHQPAQVAVLTTADVIQTAETYFGQHYIGVLLPDQRPDSTSKQP